MIFVWLYCVIKCNIDYESSNVNDYFLLIPHDLMIMNDPNDGNATHHAGVCSAFRIELMMRMIDGKRWF